MDEDISTERKTWQVYNFGKRNLFRLHLNESRPERKGKGIPCRRTERTGRAFHVDGPKNRKMREPAVESLVGEESGG